MWENTVLAGNEAGFWHFPGCHFGEDHREMPPSAPGISYATLLPLIIAPSLAGALHMECSEGCHPVNIFGKKHESQKCKQPCKCKYSICNADALGLLNELCKGIIGLGFFSPGGTYVIWTLSLLPPPSQIPILQTLPMAAVGEAAGGRSMPAFPAEELFWKLCKLNTSL